ncbi:MAG TPA: glycosyltransferase family 2 protein [Solirubrobacteraceae bacterium]|jgi:hypothetical protein|nr:glycosyltransferase family 2 protein [Solirubrobacteraceae bacterium]
MATSPLLETVIVPYRCRALVVRCLESLREHPLTRGEHVVHVVDNASGDGTVEAIGRDFPDVRLRALPHNAGFAHANNLVLREATAPYVLLLNPDTEIRDGTLDHMIDLMESDPSIGMSGCRLVQPDGTFDHAAKRSFPDPVSALAHFAGIGRRRGAAERLSRYRAPHVDEHGFGDVDAVNGAFMLVRRQALRDVGLLDEGYWLYMEDLDWCLRMHRAGWRIVYDGRVSAVHVKGGTSGQHRALRPNVAFHRGMGRYYRKFHMGERPLLDVAVLAGIGVKLLVSIVASAAARR